MLRLQLLALLIEVIFLDLTTIYTLPITSKPIENTPEHLAWEAWIMVPPTHEKTRKITPKSIFILPNKTGGGGPGGGPFSQSIQCPPGHRVDNFKCIPTISIDRNQILIAQLQNLLHSTDRYNVDGNGNDTDSNLNYDYDYDYSDSYEPDASESYSHVGKNPPSDYNNEPLKINLSFGRLPSTRDDSKETGNFGSIYDNDDENYDLNVQPFLAQEVPSSTTVRTTTTSTITKANSSITDPSTIGQTTFPTETTTAISVTTTEQTTITTDNNDEIISSSSGSTSIHSEVDAANYTAIPIISSTESEMGIKYNISEGESMLEGETSSHSAPLDASDDDLKLVPEKDENKTDIKEDLINESLVYDTEAGFEAENSTNTSNAESTDFNDETFTTIIDQDSTVDTKDETITTDAISTASITDSSVEPSSTEPTSAISSTIQLSSSSTLSSTTEKYESSTQSDVDILDHKLIQINEEAESIKRIREQLKQQEETDLPVEPVESNKRFVYHHLGNAETSNIQSTTPDFREQLRIINKIVEENKQRTQPVTSFKFPEDTVVNVQPFEPPRNDFVRFPNPEMFQQRLPIRNRITVGQDISSVPTESPTTIAPPTVSSGSQRNTKPFWWLPTGWEIDRNGQKPLLLRFWSRMPDGEDSNSRISSETPSSPTRTHRENSRSPTENLYKEISAQDVYKVLGAKNWKQNKR